MESWRPLALHPPTSQLPMTRGGADALLASDAVIRNEAAKSGGISSDIGESVLGFAIPSVTCFFPSERFDVYDTAGVARFHVSPPLSRDDRQRGMVLELRHGTAKGGARIAVLREEFGWCRCVRAAREEGSTAPRNSANDSVCDPQGGSMGGGRRPGAARAASAPSPPWRPMLYPAMLCDGRWCAGPAIGGCGTRAPRPTLSRAAARRSRSEGNDCGRACCERGRHAGERGHGCGRGASGAVGP